MKNNHGTGIPNQSYVDKFLSECKVEVESYRKSSSCVLTWPQKILLENAIIEIGGHAFDKNCPTCVLEHLTRLITYAHHLIEKPAEEKPPLKKKPNYDKAKASKVFMGKHKSFLLSDDTEVFHLKNEDISAGTNLNLIVEGSVLALPEGTHELKDGRTIIVNKFGSIVKVNQVSKEKPESNGLTQFDEQLQTNIDSLESAGGVIGKQGIHHPKQPEAFITLAQLKAMSPEEVEKVYNLFKSLSKSEPKKEAEFFIASKKHSKKVLESILTDRGVEFPKNQSQEILINTVNDLKLPIESVVIK